MRDSNQQIVQFQDRFATLTSVVNDQSDLGAALTDLSSAIGDVQRFVAGSRDQTAEQVQRLANVTQTLADHRLDLENLLHAAPNSVANAYNIYNPDTGSQIGRFAFNNLANPMAFVCGAIGAIENVTAPETGKLCAQTLGPALNSVSLNNLPFPVNPYLMKSLSPERIIYSEPSLAPGGTGPKPGAPEPPPAMSAYTGVNGDQAPPPGFGQPPAVRAWPVRTRSPAGIPVTGTVPGCSAAARPAGAAAVAPSVPALLLPAEGMPPP